MDQPLHIYKMAAPEIARDAVLVKSEALTGDEVRGYDFDADKPTDYDELMRRYLFSGFQATNLGLAINQINQMLHFKFGPNDLDPDEEKPVFGKTCGTKERLRECKIFLGLTSDIITSGMREIIKFLCKHHLVDVIVVTAGGVEEDIIKCLAPTYLGSFELKGRDLREKGINRTGNLLVPNDNYCKFQDWMYPVLDRMIEDQKTKGIHWTPSKMIKRLGEEINNEDSVWYWAAKNDIHVYSPAITDGSIGDNLYFHSYEHPGLVLDIVEDIRNMNNEAAFAKKTGTIILGGGLIKHHIMNANLMRNGADFAVYINTAAEFDGSDSGARPDEAISWGKIQEDAHPVKVYAEVTLVLPILVDQTFAKFIRGQ